MSEKKCSPTCELFKCGKGAAVYRGNTVWCRWTEDDCEVANCTYATCIKRRLLPKGVCGEFVKRKTVEHELEEIKPAVRLKGKAFRRIGEKEIF
ncbi:MAG: hypothetical protein ACQXXH_07035 [Candidatus Bathyarchaeia archaeon]|nr:hypothetical protein [Candidatus Bathyarchaeota archaeon A05DMB-4]MDH7595746.1 hypothetical protein [Candidatus Bathyarchaeota archaeon]